MLQQVHPEAMQPEDQPLGAEAAPGEDLQDHLEDHQGPGDLQDQADDRSPDLLREVAAGRIGTGSGGPEMIGIEIPAGVATQATPTQDRNSALKIEKTLSPARLFTKLLSTPGSCTLDKN